MAFPAIVALAAGEAVSAAMVMTTIASVGTVMTVVGAVTGIKDLTKIGAVMGLVGGVGSMVSGAAGAAGATAAEVTGAAVPVNGADAASVGTVANDASTTMVNGAEGATTMPVGTPAVQAQDLGQLQSAGQSPIMQVGTQATPATTTASDAWGPGDRMEVGAPQAADATQVTTPADTQTAANPYDGTLGQNRQLITGAASTAGAPQTSGNFFTNFLDFAKKNDKLLTAAAQLGGGALSGMSKAYEADRQYSLGQQQLALKQQQAGFGNSVANWGPTFTPGIISNARAKA